MRNMVTSIAAAVSIGIVLSVVGAPITPADAQKGNLRAICGKKARANTPGDTPQERKRRAMLFQQCLRNGGKL